MKTEKRFIEGNIAIVEGALAAGALFYAGYPISPSSEIAEYSSRMPPFWGPRWRGKRPIPLPAVPGFR